MDILKALKKASKNKMASVISDGTISDITEYYDTGNLLLNAQITGSIFKGLANSKTVCYSGQSKTGKTFLVIESLKNFLNIDKKNHYGVWFASEKAITKDMLKNRGVDISRVLFLPVSAVEVFNQQIWDELKEAQKIKESYKNNKESEPKFVFILDSLGQLGTTKDQKDLDKGEQKENMIRAKHVKKAFRDIEMKLAYLKIPMLFTNHVYTSIGTFVPIDIIAGGSGVMYSADIIIAMRKKKLKEGDKIIGVTMICHSYKNRFALEETKIELDILYKTGLSRYSGLFEFCKNNKIFKELKKKNDKKKKDVSEFQDYKKEREKKKKDKKKLYGFAVDEKTLIKFNEKDTEDRPEEIFTKSFLKQLDRELQPYFNYGNEYKETKSVVEKKGIKVSKVRKKILENHINKTISEGMNINSKTVKKTRKSLKKAKK